MKKEPTITALLGITQHEAAMLLCVSRSQWSMYELGKRDLPLAAKQLLAALLAYVQTPVTAAVSRPYLVQQQAKKQQKCEDLLRENEYQQLVIAKKIAVLNKKQESQARMLQLAAFLDNQHAGSKTADTAISKTIAAKVSKAVADECSAVLMEHEVKQELLVLENLLLEAKLRKIKLSIENKGNEELN